jgi:hypothetical protein
VLLKHPLDDQQARVQTGCERYREASSGSSSGAGGTDNHQPPGRHG